jgi:hypothetical protein
MAKAENIHITTAHRETIACPVIPIARRVGELWDAIDAAQKSDAADNDTVSDQIDDCRIATAELASFVRARSLAGALFQVALAHEAAERLCRDLPEEKQIYNRTYLKLNRLLTLAAAALYDQMEPEDYAPIGKVVEAYVGNLSTAMPWLDEIGGKNWGGGS